MQILAEAWPVLFIILERLFFIEVVIESNFVVKRERQSDVSFECCTSIYYHGEQPFFSSESACDLYINIPRKYVFEVPLCEGRKTLAIQKDPLNHYAPL